MKNATKRLSNRDIEALPLMQKRYSGAVGEPKELYIYVYPSGIKTFF